MKAIEITLSSFIEGIGLLLENYSVLAPVRYDGILDFRWIDDPLKIELGGQLPYKSPKEALFPRVEPIIRFEKDGITDACHEKPMIVVGVKPCDIASINMLDIIFSEKNNKFDDPFYKRRRKNLITIGIECTQKSRGCFCEELGIDRSFSDGCDAFISVNGDKLIINILNPEAGSVFSGFDGRPVESMASASKEDDHIRPDFAEDRPSTPQYSTDPDHDAKLDISADERDLFDSIPWNIYSESCLGCGTCTYVCPTCHCFEFRDVEKDGVVTRNRCWDSCMYPKFTLHASGHNPRPTQKERFRQRVLHKYLYLKRNCSIIACTGCGRCIRSCPGGVNIHRTVKDIISRIEAPDRKGAVE